MGLVGASGSGKTMLFSALTGIEISGYSEKANIGVASIPDPILDRIAQHIDPKKIVHATIQLVDIPGVVAGSDSRKIAAMMEQCRQVDAIAQVVRVFNDGVALDPVAEAQEMQSELVLADLVVAESARDKASKSARSREKDAVERLELLEKVVSLLESEKSIRQVDNWTDRENELIASYGFITAKPQLFVANVGEDDVQGVSKEVVELSKYANDLGSQCVPVCASLESEISQLESSDREEMLEGLGLVEPAVGPFARSANQALGLSTFYTAGEKEVRSWNVRQGSTAPQAAGVIHSDIERGFIRAECYFAKDLFEFKTEKEIRSAGKMRSEGKSYQMQDGDVVHFLFNV